MLPVIPAALTAVVTFGAITTIGLFALSNRKQGWVKRRKTLFAKLRDLKRDISTVPSVSYAPSVWYAGMAINPTEFSQQLGLLQTSLQRANAPVLPQTAVPRMAGRPRFGDREHDADLQNISAEL